jgi:uncharacterized C2H2 Zn-finger protein
LCTFEGSRKYNGYIVNSSTGYEAGRGKKKKKVLILPEKGYA